MAAPPPSTPEDKEDGLPHFAKDTVSFPIRNKAREIVARTVVDTADYEKLKGMSVWLRKCPTGKGKNQAFTSVDKKQVKLSHFLTGRPPEGLFKAYIDGNSMNNCQANLRNCTKSQQGQSRKRAKREGKASKYIGVKPAHNSKWRADASFDSKPHNLGLFDVEIDAAKAYDRFVLRHYGALGKQNGVLEQTEVTAVLSGDLVEEKKEKTLRALPKGVHDKKGGKYEASWKDEDGKQRYKVCRTIAEAETKYKAECQRVLTVLEQRHMTQPIKRNAKGVAVIATNQTRGVSLDIMVSDRHWYELARYSWSWNGDSASSPHGDVNSKITKMHHHVWQLDHPGEEIPKGHEVDHIHQDHADCRAESLRVLTRGGNLQNKRKRPGLSSKYTGVAYNQDNRKWKTCIDVMGKPIYLGYFTTQKAAARRYNEAVEKYYPGGMKNEISDDEEDDDDDDDDDNDDDEEDAEDEDSEDAEDAEEEEEDVDDGEPSAKRREVDSYLELHASGSTTVPACC